jgi:hypothetical protein
MHVPLHLVSQQTPSAQKPLAHCASQPQRSPLALDPDSDPVHAGIPIGPSASAAASGMSKPPPSKWPEPAEPPEPPFEPPVPACIEPDPQPTTRPKAHAQGAKRNKPDRTFTSSNPT